MVGPKAVHLVDYLTASVGNAEHAGAIVVITIRPDKDSFRPHNIALLRPQAERLLKDLQRRLTGPAILLLLFLTSGCSSRVSVTTEKSIHSETSETVEKFHTDVAVGVLADQPRQNPQESMSENAGTVVAVNVLPSPTQEMPPPQITNRVTVTNHTVINLHHLHTHFHEAPKRIKPTPKPARVEAQRRLEDPRCERLRREHEERVAKWKVMFARGQR